MSRHEGISCDICMSSNFTGLRYKCLRCYDFDLCSNCFNTGITSSRHASDHPMQRILTRADSNIFYGGEGSNANQSHSYCCPCCGRLGFTVAALTEHVQNEHSSQSYPEVLCPVCAAHPDADPNHMTDDLSGHLALIHSSSADLDPDHLADIKHLRRHNQTANRSSNNQSGGATPTSMGGGGGGGGTRNLIRGSLLHLIDPGLPLASMSGGKDIMDPITELLSHLNNVRGRLAGNPQSVSSHLQQLGMHLTSGRGQVQASTVDQTRSNPGQLDGVPKGGNPSNDGTKSGGSGGNEGGNRNNQFLLVKSLGTESSATVDSKGSLAQRPFFIQELFALCPTLVLNEGEGQAREDKPHSPASTSSTSFTRLPLSSSSSSTTSSPAPSSPSPVLRGTQLRDSDVLRVDQACSGALEDGHARLQDPELNGGREEPGIAEGEASIGYPKPAAQRKRYDRVAAEGMEERIDVNSARM